MNTAMANAFLYPYAVGWICFMQAIRVPAEMFLNFGRQAEKQEPGDIPAQVSAVILRFPIERIAMRAA